MLFKFRRIEEGSAGGGRHTTSAAGGDGEGGGVEMEVKLSGEGSLVVFTDDAYTGYRHSIDDRVGSGVEFAGGRCVNCSSSLAVGDGDNGGGGGGEEVRRGYRISLTFRHKF